MLVLVNRISDPVPMDNNVIQWKCIAARRKNLFTAAPLTRPSGIYHSVWGSSEGSRPSEW
jgi:hypothetical protein